MRKLGYFCSYTMSSFFQRHPRFDSVATSAMENDRNCGGFQEGFLLEKTADKKGPTGATPISLQKPRGPRDGVLPARSGYKLNHHGRSPSTLHIIATSPSDGGFFAALQPRWRCACPRRRGQAERAAVGSNTSGRTGTERESTASAGVTRSLMRTTKTYPLRLRSIEPPPFSTPVAMSTDPEPAKPSPLGSLKAFIRTSREKLSDLYLTGTAHAQVVPAKIEEADEKVSATLHEGMERVRELGKKASPESVVGGCTLTAAIPSAFFGLRPFVRNSGLAAAVTIAVLYPAVATDLLGIRARELGEKK
mmetsp:Transcript_17562/g.46762  ORF Transcript_17562/g.46762 Transcript_17562/m.46762 type:complete len:306 (-) Transcript_17562:112-1029(-)